MIKYNSNDDLDFEFQKSVKIVRHLSQTPNKKELLHIYSLYKQATEGNNKTKEPNILNFKENAKWKAWKKQAGKSKEKAKREYINFIDTLLVKYNQI